MILVKRCDDNVIALLIILPALAAPFVFQKIKFVIRSTPVQKAHQKHPEFTEGPSIPKGEGTSFTAADKKL
jgi:hypothetical protein